MKEILIGRKREKDDLEKWIGSDRSEFIAIYGRRRVGKTFLVKHTIGDKLCFHFSGAYGRSRKEQLQNFALSLRLQSPNAQYDVPENWLVAFHQLRSYLENYPTPQKIVFLDELPWMDTPKSGFVAALENFWNDWASWRDDIKLIVCGSATSWIVKKIINDKGGLHNRITHSLHLKPFHLRECEDYFKAYGFRYSRMQIAECYMALGGIPYYFSLMDKSESVAQNIDRLFFNADGALRNEFYNLFRALFKNFKAYESVVKTLAEKGTGMTRQEILGKSRLEDNGEFSRILENLELCGFIRSYKKFSQATMRRTPHSRTTPDTLYQLVDFFSLFYLRFHEEQEMGNENFWKSAYNSPRLNAWKGISFEMLCLCQIDRIKAAIGIADVSTRTCSWTGSRDGKKVQIDLLIDRKDDTINLCEMKFTHGKFTINKDYAEKLQDKIDVFISETETKKNVLLILITSNGIAPNAYADMVQKEVTLDQLF